MYESCQKEPGLHSITYTALSDSTASPHLSIFSRLDGSIQYRLHRMQCKSFACVIPLNTQAIKPWASMQVPLPPGASSPSLLSSHQRWTLHIQAGNVGHCYVGHQMSLNVPSTPLDRQFQISASSCQILCRSIKALRRHGRFRFFKMAAVRHLGFSKVGNFNAVATHLVPAAKAPVDKKFERSV